MITYATVKTFLDDGDFTDVQFDPGPADYEGTADSVNKAIVITIGGGPGLTLERMIDRVVVGVDVAGDQNDFASSEDLAVLVDRKMLAVDSSRLVSGVMVHDISRAGGRPTPTSVDNGDRWHHSCSYVWQVGSGV